MQPHLIRRAVVTDIAELLRLRAVMFHDMEFDAADADWTIATAARLERGLTLSTIIGAVAERSPGPGLQGCGLLQIHEGLGTPRFPTGTFGHIGSVAVDLEWRSRGIGESIVRFLIDEARTLGLERIELHATRDGERIYRRLGFTDRRGGVELRLEL